MEILIFRIFTTADAGLTPSCKVECCKKSVVAVGVGMTAVIVVVPVHIPDHVLVVFGGGEGAIVVPFVVSPVPVVVVVVTSAVFVLECPIDIMAARTTIPIQFHIMRIFWCHLHIASSLTRTLLAKTQTSYPTTMMVSMLVPKLEWPP